MKAFFVATVDVKDATKFQEYALKAKESFAPYGGRVFLRGKIDHALAGEARHQAVGIVQFPDSAALDAWYRSPEYQAIVPLRDEAADMTIVTYSVPE